MSAIDNRKDVLLLLLYAQGPSGITAEGITGRTRLMKLLYLLGEEHEIARLLDIKNWYQFEPYDYGPFSEEVYEDIDFLANVGLINATPSGPQSHSEDWEDDQVLKESIDDYQMVGVKPSELSAQETFTLTNRGLEFVTNRLLPEPSLTDDTMAIFTSIKGNEGALSLNSLLRYVYSKYPKSAEKSKLQNLRN